MRLKPVEYLPGAQLDLQESAAWYEEQEPGVGDRFQRLVGLTERKIRQHPALGTPYHRNTRKWRVPKFPFNIVYREEEHRIFIVAVAHGKREKRYWEHRVG